MTSGYSHNVMKRHEYAKKKALTKILNFSRPIGFSDEKDNIVSFIKDGKVKAIFYDNEMKKMDAYGLLHPDYDIESHQLSKNYPSFYLGEVKRNVEWELEIARRKAAFIKKREERMRNEGN